MSSPIHITQPSRIARQHQIGSGLCLLVGWVMGGALLHEVLWLGSVLSAVLEPQLLPW